MLKNQGLVVYCIDKVLKLAPNLYEEAFSAGIIGLCKAALTFDVDKGVSFSTFAFKIVRNEILIYLRGENRHSKDIHFEENINTDSDKEILLIDRYVDQNAITLYEHIEKIEYISKVISIMLNCFSGENRLIPLYFFSGIEQNVIAKRFNLARTSVAMKVKKVRDRLLDIERPYKEKFFVDIKDEKIEVSFFLNTKNDPLTIKYIDSVNLELSKKIKINLKKDKVFLRLPIEKESFSLIADVISKMEEFIV